MQRVVALLVLASMVFSCKLMPKDEKKSLKPGAGIAKSFYGMIGADSVFQYTLTNKTGMVVKILDYGGTVTNILVPDRNGKPGDVILGFDSLSGYLQAGNPYFGCLVGRYANRIANSRFILDGKEYFLKANNGINSLHGGLKGFDKVIWTVRGTEISGDHLTLALQYTSRDGEEGYPGNLTVTCAYQLTDSNELKMIYVATTDKATPVSLTNHCYFNLSAGTDKTILDHELMIKSGAFTAVDSNLIPTGELSITGVYKDIRGLEKYDLHNIPWEIKNMAMWFGEPKKTGRDIDSVKGGYDHNWVLDKKKDSLQMAASLYHAASGRYMQVFTTQPGLQFYSGNFLDGTLSGKGGVKYVKHAGLCLETQHFPDSPNQPSFPNTILKPGETYRHETIYKFLVK